MAARITNIKVRMYCLGTGDCFVLKFFTGRTLKFTMLIDCGSCQGKPADFKPYIENLVEYVKPGVDLLVITHEHQDHVNGFAKHPDLFRKLKIKKAWMAWTENPEDPDGLADDLIHKRKKMRMALQNAMNLIKQREPLIDQALQGDHYRGMMGKARQDFMKGLNTLAEINLPAAAAETGLAGMKEIKKILKEKKVKIDYMRPGETEKFVSLPGLKFHILGPPFETEAVYKHEKEGTDVYKRRLSFSTSTLAATAFLKSDKSDDFRDKDVPFAEEYIANEKKPSVMSTIATRQSATSNSSAFGVTSNYNNPMYSWRKIDSEWLNNAGSLAIRLNSHINNTSLAMAIESESTGKVVLLPGDAEYGSWESWHGIKKWKGKGKGGKHLVEDLLNRTVFYKVSHHLSFNGTPTKLGIDMMESADLVAMATLDRKRISSKWKGTMPNGKLLQDLMKRCRGRVIIMDEHEIRNAPSKQFNFPGLGKNIYDEGFDANDKKKMLYKEFRVEV